ncbi:hypothetical protein Mapa_011673 [Marchantia paleacea]|nr:hypothetical protein Mapa_011673 [Marchantia paleacea]
MHSAGATHRNTAELPRAEAEAAAAANEVELTCEGGVALLPVSSSYNSFCRIGFAQIASLSKQNCAGAFAALRWVCLGVLTWFGSGPMGQPVVGWDTGVTGLDPLDLPPDPNKPTTFWQELLSSHPLGDGTRL